MRLRDFGLLTDENLDPEVVQWLIGSGFDVLDVYQAGLRGSTDVELLRRAVSENRVIVTHDVDFGTLAIHQGEPVIGIVFLRPGHIDPKFTVGMLNSLLDLNPELPLPFILVVRRTGNQINVRIRGIVT